jgi:hypothetical protein
MLDCGYISCEELKILSRGCFAKMPAERERRFATYIKLWKKKR